LSKFLSADGFGLSFRW